MVVQGQILARSAVLGSAKPAAPVFRARGGSAGLVTRAQIFQRGHHERGATMLTVLLTSVPSNGPPFSCSCESVAVTLSGDALSSQAGRVGVYALMQGVTRFDRPVYRRSDCARVVDPPSGGGRLQQSTNYLHSVRNEYGRANWLIGPNYTSAAGGLASSWSSDFTCPENASSWQFVASEGGWHSGGGVDVACCASASCDDSLCKAAERSKASQELDGGNTTVDGKTSDEATGPGGLFAVVFFVLGFCVISCVGAAIRNFRIQKKQAALMSDAGVECEGSVTATTCHTEVDNYYLHYEFHVPASSSSHPGQANSEFGVKATGLYKVDQQVYQAHPATGLPKACTVRYVPANPYCNQLVRIGDGDRLSHNPAGFDRHRLPGKGNIYFTVTELNAAYQKPQRAPQPLVQPQPISVTMRCPPPVTRPDSTSAIASSGLMRVPSCAPAAHRMARERGFKINP